MLGTDLRREKKLIQIAENNYFKDYYQLKLDEVEKTEEEKFYDVVDQLSRKELPLEVIKPGLSNFGKTALGAGFNFLKLNLEKQNLYSLKGIDKFTHLQEIIIRNNNITKLEPLSAHRCLVYLDVSKNLLKEIKHFKPAETIVRLNLSANKFSEVPDFTEFRYLKDLNMSNNCISDMAGLGKCINLRKLDLSNNVIEDIYDINKLRLKELYLQGNKIEMLPGLNKLKELTILNLARNGIRSLNELSNLESLRNIDLSSNKIAKIKELDNIRNLPFLTYLDLCYNSCQKEKFYKLQVIYKIPQIRELDGVPISYQDLVKSEIFYGHDLDEKKKRFSQILQNEEFIDRRLISSHMLDPEDDAPPADYDFFDKYDEDGKKIERRPPFLSNNTKFPFSMNASTQNPFETAVSMQQVTTNFKQMQEAIYNNRNSGKGMSFNLSSKMVQGN